MQLPPLQRLAYPAVTALVSFLAYSSQVLFYFIRPGPLTGSAFWFFNAVVIGLLICYTRTCFTDPGKIPPDWKPEGAEGSGLVNKSDANNLSTRQRWCRKCEAFKPPRAHHCKICKRCVPKMDHHCVWTANCVSHVTMPHFIRFVVYAVVAMITLEYFIFIRLSVVWNSKHLPSYLGPNPMQLVHLFLLLVTNSLVLFALAILLARVIWSLALNTTTIEGWEIERHHALLRRSRVLGGFLDGPNGTKVRIERQEFPWDIGIWANICQGMGTRNFLGWLWPFSRSPAVKTGLSFPDNGIEDPPKPWPPPDPDRMFRVPRAQPDESNNDGFTQSFDLEAFRKRQEADLARHESDRPYRRLPFHERYETTQTVKQPAERTYPEDNYYADHGDSDSEPDADTGNQHTYLRDGEGEEAWRNSEGERLGDFGVDEDADFYDEDDVPLAQLIRMRQKAK